MKDVGRPAGKFLVPGTIASAFAAIQAIWLRFPALDSIFSLLMAKLNLLKRFYNS